MQREAADLLPEIDGHESTVLFRGTLCPEFVPAPLQVGLRAIRKIGPDRKMPVASRERFLREFKVVAHEHGCAARPDGLLKQCPHQFRTLEGFPLGTPVHANVPQRESQHEADSVHR